MSLVLAIYLLLLYLYYSNRQNNNPNACKNYGIAASLFLFMISALRHEAVGNDTYAYMMQFESFSKDWGEIFRGFFIRYLAPGDFDKDPGYDIVMKLCSYITNDSRVFLVIISGVTIASLFFFIKRNTNNLRAVFFSYLFFSIMFFQYVPNSSFRQSLAFSLLLVSYDVLKKGKWQYAIMFIFIASTLHKSALSGLAMFVLHYFNNVRTIFKLGIIAFVVVLLFPTEVASFLGGTSDIYNAYATSAYYQTTAKPYMVIILMLGLYVISLMIINRDNSPEDNKMLYYGAMLAFVLTPLVWSDPSTLRLLSYFGLFLSILIGEKITIVPNGKQIFIVVVIIFIIKVAISGDNYHFMWQYMQLHERYYSSLLHDAIYYLV